MTPLGAKISAALPFLLAVVSMAHAQTAASASGVPRVIVPLAPQPTVGANGTPRVIIPTNSRQTIPLQPVNPNARVLYPWRLAVTATVFWVGEQPSERNPTPNTKSSWDQNWTSNFGGYDDPNPTSRVMDFQNGDFRPKNFTPKLNPFYIALPYNDVINHAAHKSEASKVIPWFSRLRPEPGKTVCKGRWLQIFYNNRSCYAQWEDCGPWVTDDWEYVFGNKPPKNTSNKAAGIDISPAVRDYLGITSGQKVHWRFVEAGQVPYGPWKKYGQNGADPNLESQRKYLEYLRKLRDQEFQKKPLGQ